VAGVDHDALRPHQGERAGGRSQSPVAAPPDRRPQRCQRRVGTPLDDCHGGAVVAEDGVEKPTKSMDDGAWPVPAHRGAHRQAAVPREERRTPATAETDRRSR
jgi:hypothetical protein